MREKPALQLKPTTPRIAGLAALAFLTFAFPAEAAKTDVFRGLNRLGLAAKHNTHFNGNPPDPTGAVGRRHFLQAVNVRLALWGRSNLRRVASRDAYDFWGKEPIGQVVDPQILWDDSARRWYYVAIYNRPTDQNEVLLSWSKNGDPSDLDRSWCRMAIPTGKLFDDFPNLGFSRNHILIGTNVADLEERKILFSRLWAIGKPAHGDASCARLPVASFGSRARPLHQADGRPAFTLAPANPVRPTSDGYVIAADCIDEEGGEAQCSRRRGNGITVWHVHGSRNAPKLTRDGGIRVPAYRLPSRIPQPHSREKLAAGDTTLTQATSAPDRTRRLREAVWTQHTVRDRRGRSEVRWYELDPRRLRVVRRGRIASRRNWVFNAAISPSWRGSGAAINYNVAGRRLLPQIRARSRGPRTARSALRKPVVLGHSAAPDRCGEPACPWGDYAAATPDPLRQTVVWGSNELLRSTRNADPFIGQHWGTRNFAIRTDGPDRPAGRPPTRCGLFPAKSSAAFAAC